MHLPHRLVLRPSRFLAALLLLLHIAALLGLLPIRLPLGLKLILAAVVAASGVVSLRRHALRVAGISVRELILKADGAVEGTQGDGSRFEAKVSLQSTIWPWLIVLLLERPGSPRLRPLVVLPDALPAEELRILRSWLRWKLT